MKKLLLLLTFCVAMVSCDKEDIKNEELKVAKLSEFLEGKTFIGRYTGINGCDFGVCTFTVNDSESNDKFFKFSIHEYYSTAGPGMSGNAFRYEYFKEVENGIYEGTYTDNTNIEQYFKIDTKKSLVTLWSRNSYNQYYEFIAVEGVLQDYRPSREDFQNFAGLYIGNDGNEYNLSIDGDDLRLDGGKQLYISYSSYLEWSDGAIIKGNACTRNSLNSLWMKDAEVIAEWVKRDDTVERMTFTKI
jgi:hypothetical protein